MPGSLPLDRFWRKVNKNGPVPEHRPDLGPCWLWTGGISRPRTPERAYGRFSANGASRPAHHVAYELLTGREVPAGLEWDHLCRVTLCVRPSHGEWVTRRENLIRSFGVVGLNARKTHCKDGHPFDDTNTYVDRRGFRVCRTCFRSYKRAYRRRKAEQIREAA